MDPARQPRLLADGSFVDAGARAGRATVLLSRGLCRTRYVDLALVPVAQRLSALRHQLTAWAPFDRPSFVVAERGAGFQVIAWDAERAASALRTAAWPDDTRLSCEQAHRPAMAGNGVRLIDGLDGSEAQCWREGRLLHSRWWPTPPDEAQWALFLRGGPQSTGETDAALPRPSTDPLPWLARPPIAYRALDEVVSRSSKWERVVVAAVGLGLLAFSGAQAHLALDALRAQRHAQDELSTLQQATAPFLLKRDRALAQTALASKLAEAVTGVLPVELLAHLDEVLPRKGVVLQDLDLNGLKLRLDLSLSPQVSHSELIAALQRSAWLVDVTEAKGQAGRSTVPFDMRLRSARPPAVAVVRPAPVASGAAGARP